MIKYIPPGNLDDLANRPSRQGFLDDWHEFIAREMKLNIEGLKDPRDAKGNLVDTPIPNPLFFREVDTPTTSEDLPVTWNAFPLVITREHRNDHAAAWLAADEIQTTDIFTPENAPKVFTKFRPQDEYCEWRVYTDPVTKKIIRAVFTAEGPEYWIRLAKHDFDQVLSLYRRYVSPEVTKADLQLTTAIDFGGETLEKGSYNPFNVWNTEAGIMHLTHPANTLGAEINLAARATALRGDKKGERVIETRRLVCCSGFGDANRSSDPTIGQGVNVTALGVQPGDAPVRITLANPVGLYMDSLKSGTLTDPVGQPLDGWVRFERGVVGRGLMAIIEPSPGSTFGFDRLRVKGAEFSRGGQIAEAIQMVLYARTAPYEGPPPPLAPCAFHCCVLNGTPADKIKDMNLPSSRTFVSCAKFGQQSVPPVDLVDAFPDVLPAAPPGLAPPMVETAPIRRNTRLGPEQ